MCSSQLARLANCILTLQGNILFSSFHELKFLFLILGTVLDQMISTLFVILPTGQVIDRAKVSLSQRTLMEHPVRMLYTHLVT